MGKGDWAGGHGVGVSGGGETEWPSCGVRGIQGVGGFNQGAESNDL